MEVADVVKVAAVFKELLCGVLLVVVVWILVGGRDGR